MTKPNALHHLAISTADIKKQIAFFSDVPHMDYPREAYEMLLQTPDEVIWETASETTAPSPNGYGS